MGISKRCFSGTRQINGRTRKTKAIRISVAYLDGLRGIRFNFTLSDYGKIVVALDNDSRNTLKRLEFDNEKKRPYLHPENKKYKDIYPAELSVQGVAEKVIKNLN